MKLSETRITTDIIKALSPCKDRLANWIENYPMFNGDIIDFLSLDKITPKDKIWVCVRVLPREQIEYFAVDCAVSAAVAYAADADAAADAAAYAYAYAYAAYAADAADAAYAYAYAAAYAAADAAAYADAAAAAADAAADAAYAADDAAYAAADAYAAERERQVYCLIYLITTAEQE